MDIGYSGSALNSTGPMTGGPGVAPKMSEWQQEASRLNMCISHCHEVIQDLAKKLAPITRPIQSGNSRAEKTPSPITEHAQYLSQKCSDIEMVNEAIHALLQNIEI